MFHGTNAGSFKSSANAASRGREGNTKNYQNQRSGGGGGGSRGGGGQYGGGGGQYGGGGGYHNGGNNQGGSGGYHPNNSGGGGGYHNGGGGGYPGGGGGYYQGAINHITGELDKLTMHEKYRGNDQIYTAANGPGLNSAAHGMENGKKF
nr:dormancy-associated protein 2-like [Aegilops tauschii subsp. strangulata]